MTRLSESIQRHEAAIAAERRALVSAVVQVAEHSSDCMSRVTPDFCDCSYDEDAACILGPALAGLREHFPGLMEGKDNA